MTEYAEALAAFKASPDWIKGSDPVSLGASVAVQRFLENRLIIAYQAGYLAGLENGIERMKWKPIEEPEGIELPPETV